MFIIPSENIPFPFPVQPALTKIDENRASKILSKLNQRKILRTFFQRLTLVFPPRLFTHLITTGDRFIRSR